MQNFSLPTCVALDVASVTKGRKMSPVVFVMSAYLYVRLQNNLETSKRILMKVFIGDTYFLLQLKKLTVSS
jgi:hypothetical protein